MVARYDLLKPYTRHHEEERVRKRFIGGGERPGVPAAIRHGPRNPCASGRQRPAGKHAATLGLDAEKGARHLAGHPDGRAQHWRGFTEALDALALDAAQETRLIDGARHAFARVKDHAERAFAD